MAPKNNKIKNWKITLRCKTRGRISKHHIKQMRVIGINTPLQSNSDEVQDADSFMDSFVQ